MTTCSDAHVHLEGLAAGETVPGEVRAHIAGCALCAARLRLAERIERALVERPIPDPAPAFTVALMARIRQERWRAEQRLDWGFNIFVALGVALILVGVAGAFNASGLVVIGRDLLGAMDVAALTSARLVATEAPTLIYAALLLTLTLGVWWWVEADLTI